MILSDEQMRWCAEHLLGIGYDDDDEDKVQYVHVCETLRGGTKPAALEVGTRTRRKLVRERRSRNAYARLFSRSVSRRGMPIAARGHDGVFSTHIIHKTPADSAHHARLRWTDHEEDRLPNQQRGRACAACTNRLGRYGVHMSTSVRQRHGWRDLAYCRDCCISGAAGRDQERRAQAGMKHRPTQPRSHFVALCRSPRLWFGQGEDYAWPEGDEKPNEITCVDCQRLLVERGCPSAS